MSFSNTPIDLSKEILECGIPDKSLIIIKEVIQHLSLDSGLNMLSNIKKSGIKYIAITNHDKIKFNISKNPNIKDGDFYPNNIFLEPFNFKNSILDINDFLPDKFHGYGNLVIFDIQEQKIDIISNYVTFHSFDNIFHVLNEDIFNMKNIKNISSSTLYIINDNIDINSTIQKWRKIILNSLFRKIIYLSKNELDNLNIKHIVISGEHNFKWHEFIVFDQDLLYIDMINKIKENQNIQSNKGIYILLNQRNIDNRYLYESNTKITLENYLIKNLEFNKLPIVICNFNKLSPVDQIKMCSMAKIFISVHGADLTNLIYTPADCHIIEISFRKYWYCDNLCDDHFTGKIKFSEKCNGKLNFLPYYHQACYHNLSYLTNHKYTELSADDYEGAYSKNPICKKKIYVDGNELINIINNIL